MPPIQPDTGAALAAPPDLTLVIPAGLPEAQRFRVQAHAAGQRLLGASSLARNAVRIDVSFVMGTALFIRLSKP